MAKAVLIYVKNQRGGLSPQLSFMPHLKVPDEFDRIDLSDEEAKLPLDVLRKMYPRIRPPDK